MGVLLQARFSMSVPQQHFPAVVPFQAVPLPTVVLSDQEFCWCIYILFYFLTVHGVLISKSLAWPGRKQANISVRMTWISFGAMPCRKKKTWCQLASRCCWNRVRPWHTSEVVSFLVRLRTYQHPGRLWNHVDTNCNEIFPSFLLAMHLCLKKERCMYFNTILFFFIPWTPFKYLYILQLKNQQHHSVSKYCIAYPIPTSMYEFSPEGSKVRNFLPFLKRPLEQDFLPVYYMCCMTCLQTWLTDGSLVGDFIQNVLEHFCLFCSVSLFFCYTPTDWNSLVALLYSRGAKANWTPQIWDLFDCASSSWNNLKCQLEATR